MDNPKISIIVPVYNAALYLNRCLNSILEQTFPDFEVLLIDDGSKDTSGKICDEYAFKDSRIKVYHKENGGVASARQLGCDLAKGIYSIHVDPDDWVEADMLKKMYDTALKNNADIVISDFYIQRSENITYSCQKPQSFVPKDIIKDILENKLFGALWHKLIRHSLYKKYNIRFVSGINYCEDVLILAQLCLKNIKISYLNEAFYHYCQNETSITAKMSPVLFNTCIRLFAEYKRLLPASFDNIIQNGFLGHKIWAVKDNVIGKDEFNSNYQFSFKQLRIYNLRKRAKLFLLFNHFGLFNLGKKILK